MKNDHFEGEPTLQICFPIYREDDELQLMIALKSAVELIGKELNRDSKIRAAQWLLDRLKEPASSQLVTP